MGCYLFPMVKLVEFNLIFKDFASGGDLTSGPSRCPLKLLSYINPLHNHNFLMLTKVVKMFIS